MAIMKPTRVIFSVLCLLVTGFIQSCTQQLVSYDFDPAINFAAFKKYRWLGKQPATTDDPRVKNDLLHARIERSINEVLTAKGYVLPAEGPVDFLIIYQLGIEKRTDVDRVNTGIGFSHSVWDMGFHTETVVREYNQMTLYIDVLDPVSKKLIWRGTRDYRYRSGGSVVEREARVMKIVRSILAGFPP